MQVRGPDAGRLAQILCARALARCQVGQGNYVAVCNHDGVKRQQLGVILEGDTPTALGFRSRCVRRDAQLGAQALHRAAQLCHVRLQARDALGGLV